MKIVKKVIIPGEEEVFSPIQGDPNEPFEIIGTGEVPIEDSDFEPIIQEEEVPTEPVLTAGPTGPPGPQGPEGPQGAAGGGTAETWDTENPTTATDFSGIPAGTVIDIGTSSIDILKSMLYPITISFSAFDMFTTPDVARYYHVGDSIASGSYEATWTLNGAASAVENSLKIVQGSTTLFTGTPTDTDTTFTHGPYTSSVEATKNFTISVTGAYNDTISRNDSYYWRYPMYAGKTSGSSITSSDVENLLVTTQPTGGKNPFIFYSIATMRSGVTLEFPFTSEENYIYWIVPKTANGSPISNYPEFSTSDSFTDVTNPNVTQPVAMSNTINTLSVTKHGVTVVFDVYRSANSFIGAITVKAQETS